MTPEQVLFGLIFVNFGPLKIFPKMKPHKSVKIQIITIKRKIFNPYLSLTKYTKKKEIKLMKKI